MTAYILGAATLILAILIVWRLVSPEFKQKSERPKYRLLSDLGIDLHGEHSEESDAHERKRKE